MARKWSDEERWKRTYGKSPYLIVPRGYIRLGKVMKADIKRQKK
jgi:hypothetical protein